jgi:hypothetical protein
VFVLCPYYHALTIYIVSFAAIKVSDRQGQLYHYLGKRGHVFIDVAIGPNAAYILGRGNKIVAIGCHLYG